MTFILIAHISIEEVKQSLIDIEAWLAKNAKDVYEAMNKKKPATIDDVKKLSAAINDKITSNLEALLRYSRPNLLLRDMYKTLSVDGILDALEVNQVNGYWKKNYIPFAVDEEDNYLVLENLNGNHF